MTFWAHSRWKIFSQNQHPYRHSLDDFAYTHDALPPGVVSTVQGALDWLFAVLYPQMQDAVANVAALPSVGNTLNDMRVVLDDGDGKAASYRWEQREGEASASWHKIYDMDWGQDTILEQFYIKTQDIYVHRLGYDDIDSSGSILTGINRGQTIYGGRTANGHLTLKANSGDGVGAATGYVQMGDNARPQVDSTYSLGTTAERWLKIWTDEITSATCTIVSGSITDSSGAISFDNENLSTTGTLASGTHTVGNMVIASASITNTGGSISFDNENLSTTGTLASGTHTIGTLVLAAASITDTSGSISFADENLSTTGTLSAGNSSFTRADVDNLRLDANTLSSTSGNLILTGFANVVISAATAVDIQTAMTTIGQTITGTVAITGQLNADNLRLDGNTISSTDVNGNVIIDPNGSGLVELGAAFFPTTDSTWDIGKTGNVWNKLWLDGSIGDGTTEIASSVLQSLRDINSGVGSGFTIFWNGSKWVSSLPDTEVDHGSISGLTDDDHTQYALLAGRSGGQSIIGGTASGDDLTLESTSHGTKGDIFVSSDLCPTTNASHSGSWSGTDLGDATHIFRHVYTAGEFIGFRLENLGALPSSSATREGRLLYYTSDDQIYLDNGASVYRVSLKRYEEDTSWDGATTSKSVTVSGLDARKAIWILKDNTNDYEQMPVKITHTGATNVTITVNIALPAGSYRLIGIE